MLDPGPSDRRRGWVVTVVLTLIAAATRFIGLTSPTEGGTPVFDEKHYAPQAWQVLHGGWVEDNPAYGLVVHPPMGKQLMALGEALFGYTPLGWRFAAAVAGTLMVLLVIRITRRLTRSTMLGAAAGIMLIADGMTLVSSRIGMLDIFLALFVLGAFGCLVVDRDQVRARLYRAYTEGRHAVSPYGPRLGVRWWRFGAGVLLGLACATKWSGIYYILFFGLLSIGFDVAARRTFRVPRPWRGTIVRDVLPALWALVLIPLLGYLASYTGWFASETGYDRYAVGNTIGTGGAWSWLPDALRSLWHYQGETLKFHAGLTNSAGNHHPWESKPWTWPMGLRPMMYHLADTGVTGCGQPMCVRAVMLIGTPALWWVSLPMLGWALWRTLTARDWRYAAVLVGYAAGLLPWFVVLDREMYYFYAVTMAPFLVIGLALALGDILGPAPYLRLPRRAWLLGASERQTLGLVLACLYLGLVVANAIWLWPILTAMPITNDSWRQHLWLPSWR